MRKKLSIHILYILLIILFIVSVPLWADEAAVNGLRGWIDNGNSLSTDRSVSIGTPLVVSAGDKNIIAMADATTAGVSLDGDSYRVVYGNSVAFIGNTGTSQYGVNAGTQKSTIYNTYGSIEIGIAGADITVVPPSKIVSVTGAVKQSYYAWQDDFDQEAAAVELNNGLKTDEWTEGGTNSATANVTYTAGAGGTLALVTAGGDDDSQFILHLPNVRVDSNPILEARFKITDITNAYVAVGFVEGSYVDKATHDDDIALVGFDSDNGHTFGAAQLVGIFNDNNGGVDYDNTGVAIVANTYVIVRIDLTDTEQPRIWINNTEVLAASITGTVQAATTLMPYFMVQSLSGAADTATIDYIKVWQDRG